MKKAFKIAGLVIILPMLYLSTNYVVKHNSATSDASDHHASANQSKKQLNHNQIAKPAIRHKKPKKNLWNSGSVINVTHLTNQQWLNHIRKSDFQTPSDGPYPQIKDWKQVWIDVNISKQRIYFKKGKQILYTMLTSSGLDTNPDTSTPLGTYYVQAERGKSFYSAKYHEGAKYWTSWKNHGEFLFHTVPVDKQGKIIESVADQLGHKASHGCFHLTFSDAKWINQNVPVGTKVVIHD